MRFRAGGVAIIAVVIAACSPSQAGHPIVPGPSSSGSASSGDQPDGDGAPRVSNPLDTKSFEQDPCKMLSTDQASELGKDVQKRLDSKSATGLSCIWTTEDGSSVGLGFVSNSGGLAGVYQQNKMAPKPYFIPVASVAGYPGVFASDSDMRPDGFCVLAVGVQNQSALLADSTFGTKSPNRADPCPAVQKFAEYAVNNIKGAA